MLSSSEYHLPIQANVYWVYIHCYWVASSWSLLLYPACWWFQRSFCWETCSTSDQPFSYFVSLRELIDTPTREYKILDWVLTNILFAVVSHVILDPISNLDHNPIFIKFNFSLQRCSASKPFTVWDYAKGNFSDLNNALYATPWEFIIMNSPNVDSALLNVTDVINQTLKTFIPTKIIYPCKRNKPWFNNELKTLIRKRTRYYKR